MALPFVAELDDGLVPGISLLVSHNFAGRLQARVTQPSLANQAEHNQQQKTNANDLTNQESDFRFGFWSHAAPPWE